MTTTRSGTGCFIAVPMWQQLASKRTLVRWRFVDPPPGVSTLHPEGLILQRGAVATELSDAASVTHIIYRVSLCVGIMIYFGSGCSTADN